MATNNNNNEQNQNDVYGGLFQTDQLFNDFYSSKPDSDVGKAIKQTFQGNMIQSIMDQSMAVQMANIQAGIGTQNMQTAAELERTNNEAAMADEFRYGLGVMDAQFQHQNNFANATYDRDIGMLGATGVENRKNQDNESANRIQETIKAGEQQRLNTAVQGEIDINKQNIAANASKYGADATKEASMYGSQKQAEASMYGSQKQAEASMYGAKETADANRYAAEQQSAASIYGSTKQAEASMYGAKESANASRYGADRSAEASMYGAAQQRDASMYQSDANLAGTKYSADATKEASKYQSDASVTNTARTAQAQENIASTNLEGTKYSADATKEASKYGADATKEASMYGADAAKEASMYGADQQLAGIKDTNLTSTRNIQTTGDETRKTNAQANQFSIDKENRANARSRAGARRY